MEAPATEYSTKVVNVRYERFDAYIGRFNSSRGLRASIFANPFKIGPDGTRTEVIEKYKNYILRRPDLIIEARKLKGKRLGCWCRPEACHGDILVLIAEGVLGDAPGD